ncbi:hypothetical protein AMTR_s00134p00070280 [Amborella trichopoda]|uniref:Uncharacterized protein n=1 Tax=Amborella trichopoda TaxID=13333 RepID=W1P7L3_AMBTC|nr:hypothetical protein AMTR_s00134p00070280 [Amborella trichopoda]
MAHGKKETQNKKSRANWANYGAKSINEGPSSVHEAMTEVTQLEKFVMFVTTALDPDWLELQPIA